MKNSYDIRGETTAIRIVQRDGSEHECLIDTSDLELVSICSWSVSWTPATQSFYCTGFANGSLQQMQRLIMKPSHPLVVDHINHDTLDNRRSNLRCVSRTVNQLNRKSATKRSRSGVRGVSWRADRSKWVARITIHGQEVRIGHFTSLDEARVAVETARAELMAELLKDERHAA